MMLIKKILGFSWLLSCALALPGGIPAAQGQEQTPSTTELEAQPNTSQYPDPAVRRRRGFPAPTQQQTPNPDPPAQTNPPANPAVNPPVNNVQPNNSPANPINRPVSTTPVYAAPVSQQNGLIGPPAPPPTTLEQMAPTPAKIVYQNGVLSVESVNARLIDILNGIRAKTGIQFEGIQTSNDRVAGKFGPAPADQVLTSLLQGSRFDYVIIGVPDQPSQVQRVLLSPSSAAGVVAGAPGAPAQRSGDDDDDSAEDASTDAPEQAPQQAQQPARPRGIGGAKTTEQLLEELKQLQQSQLQNQQNEQNQQNQANPANQSQPQNPPAPQQPTIRPH